MIELETRLDEFLTLVVGDRNPWSAPDRHATVPQLVTDRWQGIGLEAELDEFTVTGITGRTVWVPPPDPTGRFILALAHHDTVPHSPGADDNGSGMAVVDALAHRLARDPGPNLALALVDFEEGHPRRWKERAARGGTEDEGFAEWFSAEYGTPQLAFPGSRRLLAGLEHAGLVDRLEVLLNFETVGYTAPTQAIPAAVPVEGELPGDFVALVGNEPARAWVDRLTAASADPVFPLVVPGAGELMPDTRRSDHAPFWERGLPAVMLTDSAEFRNPHYHLPTDTEVDLGFLASVVRRTQDAIWV